MVKKRITFNLNLNFQQIATYYDKVSGKEYIYFTDFFTKKCINIFDIKGKKVDSIPLQNSLNSLDKILSVCMINRDSILINAPYSNKIILINRKGEVLKKINLDTLLFDNKGNHYELWNFKLLSDGSFIFHTAWRYNINNKIKNILMQSKQKISIIHNNYNSKMIVNNHN